MIKRRSMSSSLLALIPFLSSNIAYADDMLDARTSGIAILRKLEQHKNSDVWGVWMFLVGLRKG